MEMVVTVLQLQ
jgi:hypothetical protein